jgi:hypothetical protein
MSAISPFVLARLEHLLNAAFTRFTYVPPTKANLKKLLKIADDILFEFGKENQIEETVLMELRKTTREVIHTELADRKKKPLP